VHIAPNNIRRQSATCSLLIKIKENYNLPAHTDILKKPAKRLNSRNPVWEFIDFELDIGMQCQDSGESQSQQH